jgi:hypothetical protein
MKQRLRFFEEAAAEIEHERAWYRSKSEVAEAGSCESSNTHSGR